VTTVVLTLANGRMMQEAPFGIGLKNHPPQS